MFPTLGLFASVRCPELSASNPGGPCKRNPCLFSHTAPPPRTAAITSSKALTSSTSNGSTSTIKRSSDAVVRNGKGNTEDDDADGDVRPRKLQKQTSNGAVSKTSTLFTKDEDDVEALTSQTTYKTAPVAVGTSRLGAPRAMGGARTSSMVITGSGKVIRKGPAPALQAKPASPVYSSATSQTSSLKGKERAPVQSNSRPAAVSAFMSDVGPPRLPLNTPASYVPVVTRNGMVKMMYQEFIRVYENFSPKQRHGMASEHALSQEATIYGKNNKVGARREHKMTVMQANTGLYSSATKQHA